MSFRLNMQRQCDITDHVCKTSRIALTGRLNTGPPCSVGRPTADASGPAAADRLRARRACNINTERCHVTCSPRPPTLSQHHTWICVCGPAHDVVICSKFYRNPFMGFEGPLGRNLPFPITLVISFYYFTTAWVSKPWQAVITVCFFSISAEDVNWDFTSIVITSCSHTVTVMVISTVYRRRCEEFAQSLPVQTVLFVWFVVQSTNPQQIEQDSCRLALCIGLRHTALLKPWLQGECVWWCRV